MALGLRLHGLPARVLCLLSDGELQEGSTWEAAMAGGHYQLERLFALVDCNNQQADGPPARVMAVEPVVEKWAAFGWDAQRVNGNDVAALLAAIRSAKSAGGRPHAIVLDTLMGRGVPLFERREKNHFIRVDPEEWAIARPSWRKRRRRSGPGVTGSLLASTPAAAATVAAPFGRALVAAAERDPRIVGLTADLGKYTDLHLFAERFPERFFQAGMAEQNLIAVAAGMARTGWIPFATTYCVFATRRAYDFIAIGAAFGRANVKIIAGLPGLTTGYGGTHQGIEDLALMRAVPNLVVIDPCDATELAQAVPAVAAYPGRSTCGCCAERCRSSSIPLPTASRLAGRATAWRRRRGAGQHRPDDRPRPGSRGPAGHRGDRGLGAPREHPEAVRPRGSARRGPRGPRGGDRREPRRERWSRERRRRLYCGCRPGDPAAAGRDPRLFLRKRIDPVPREAVWAGRGKCRRRRPGSAPGMKITGLETFLANAGLRNYLFVRLTTDSGLHRPGRGVAGMAGAGGRSAPARLGRGPRVVGQRPVRRRAARSAA